VIVDEVQGPKCLVVALLTVRCNERWRQKCLSSSTNDLQRVQTVMKVRRKDKSRLSANVRVEYVCNHREVTALIFKQVLTLLL